MMPSEPLEHLRSYLDRWAALHRSCEPANRVVAEESVGLAYRAAGLPPPQRVVWCGGPIEIARQLAAASADTDIGANVKAEICEDQLHRVGTFAEIFWKEIIVAGTELAQDGGVGAAAREYETCKRASGAINRLVRDAADDHLFRLRHRVQHAVRWMRGQPRLLPRETFDEIAIGPGQFASLGIYEYVHDALPWKDLTGPLRGLWRIGACAGWIVPHERVCWISERPDRLRVDAKGRLHCADGPALRYRDGWSAYAWKGVAVPDWMIGHPERITRTTIADTFDPVLRNCMIEIMTPERFVKSGAPSRVAEDECGVLWRKLWGYRGVTVGSWTAVEVVNGTVEPDGSRRRYFLRVPSRMRTAREAVAWTYGMSAQEYVRLDVRT